MSALRVITCLGQFKRRDNQVYTLPIPPVLKYKFTQLLPTIPAFAIDESISIPTKVIEEVEAPQAQVSHEGQSDETREFQRHFQ